MKYKNYATANLAKKTLLFSTIAALSVPVFSATSEYAIEEVIVTATKRSENLQDVPVSVSAISSKQLITRGVTTSNDLGMVVPSLQVSSQYGETSPNFSLRGVGVANEFTANTASPVGVYVDEVSQTFRYTHGLQLYDLDRVEVVRGPQGTLFGRNTTGGAISIYTRQPELGESNGFITGSFGNYNRIKVTGAAEFTPVEDKVGFRFAFTRGEGDGYFDEPNSSFGEDDYGSLDTLGYRATLRFKPTEDLDIAVKYIYNKDDPIGYPLHYIGLVGGFGGTDFFGSDRNGSDCCDYDEVSLDKGGKFITKNKGTSVNINYTINDNWSITSVTGYTESEYTLNIDNDATPLDAYFIVYDSDGEDFSQDFRLNYQSDRFKGLLGLYYGKDTIETSNVVTAYNVLPDAMTAADWVAPGVSHSLNVLFGYDQERETTAVYGEGTFSVTDKLDLTFGARYTEDTVDFLDAFSSVYSDIPGNFLFDLFADANIKNEYDNWSGRVILDYQWTDNIKTYLSFTRGFRSGTYNGFGFITPAAIYFVEPEQLDSFEFGFKTRFFDDRLQINGAVFDYDYKKQQVQEVIGGVAFLRSLDSKVLGAELEVLARPTAALTVRATLGLLDTEYEDGQLLSGVDVGGNELPFASDVTASLGGDLVLGAISEGEVILSLEAAYKSEIFYDPFTDALRPDPTNLYGGTPSNPVGQSDEIQSDSYTLVNARLSYVSEAITVALWAKNLTDKDYYPFGYDTAGAFGTVLLTPGVPRTYGIDLTYNF